MEAPTPLFLLFLVLALSPPLLTAEEASEVPPPTTPKPEFESIHLDVMFREFANVSNLAGVAEFLAQQALERNPDMMRVIDFLRSDDFKAINDCLWSIQGRRGERGTGIAVH